MSKIRSGYSKTLGLSDVALLNGNTFMFISQSANITGSSPKTFNFRTPSNVSKTVILDEISFNCLKSQAVVTISSGSISQSFADATNLTCSVFPGTAVTTLNTNQSTNVSPTVTLFINPTFVPAGTTLKAGYSSSSLARIADGLTSSYATIYTDVVNSGSKFVSMPKLVLKGSTDYEVKVIDQSLDLQNYYFKFLWTERPTDEQ